MYYVYVHIHRRTEEAFMYRQERSKMLAPLSSPPFSQLHQGSLPESLSQHFHRHLIGLRLVLRPHQATTETAK